MEKLEQCKIETVNQRLYDKLTQLVGTEEDIRIRQQMFFVMDTVNGFGDKDSLSMSTGSLSEGFDMKGSDEDMMLVLKDIEVVSPHSEITTRRAGVTYVHADLDHTRPGYAKLSKPLEQDSKVNDYIKNGLQEHQGGHVVSSSKFRDQFINEGHTHHGPCLSDGIYDFAISLHCPTLPTYIKERLSKCLSINWLTKGETETLMAGGYHFVPVGPRNCDDYHLLWRISFALIEKKLVHAMNYTQLLCYGLLKIVLKEGKVADATLKDQLCSYFLKTCMFWLIEETDNDSSIWNITNLTGCFSMCLDRVIKWVDECNCPNYLSPENNMFIGKVHKRNFKSLLSVLISFKSEGNMRLCRCISLRNFLEHSVQPTEGEREASLDLLCFRILHIYPFDGIDLLYLATERMEEMYNVESRDFVRGVINVMRSSIHGEIAQLVHLQVGQNTDEKETRRQQLLHMLKVKRTNISGGLNLLAAFNYVHGRYCKALNIADAVIRNMREKTFLHRRKSEYTAEEMHWYLNKMCGRGLSLEQKFDQATIKSTVFLQNSPFIPAEFQPEVENDLLTCPPFVFANALKVLCYHKLEDNAKTQEALEVLENNVMSKQYILDEGNPGYSVALTLLGACHEVLNELESAQKYYEMAMNPNKLICSSTKARLRKIKHSRI